MALSTAGERNRSNAGVTRLQVPIGTWGLRISALTYLLAFVGVPLLVVNVSGFRSGFEAFWNEITQPIPLNAIGLTLITAAVMTVINMVMGVLTAYVLVYYQFPGKRLFNAIIDLPIAIPTLVTGVMLVLLYGPQTVVGGFLENNLGLQVLFAPPGIVLALLFISYPFVIRAVQPVLLELDDNQQEAAYTLGASQVRTFFSVILPAIRPAVITGGVLGFARALGEFGSVVLVSGNIAMRTLTATVYIAQKVEGGDMNGAASVSVVLFGLAFAITLTLDLLMARKVKPTYEGD
ncbi:MAG: ABC transporter permease [Anaerolineae bacterium]